MAGCIDSDSSSNDENDMKDADKTKKHKKPIKESQQKFGHPVYKKLSHLNSAVNRMKRTEIIEQLTASGLSTSGVTEVLKKRLKSHYKQSELCGVRVEEGGRAYPYYLVIDFEATCQESNPDDWQHEIIEFPAVLINTDTQQVEAEFRSFVRPVLNPTLSEFCTQLTGITQEDVDVSPTFPEVLTEVEKWMTQHKLHKKNTAIITDGPWDMGRFMHTQCQVSKIPFPKWARKWVNIRKTYCNFYGFNKVRLLTMLENLGLNFDGHQHSGIDDSRNIASIALQLLTDGCPLKINEQINSHKIDKHKVTKKDTVKSVKSEERKCSKDETVTSEELVEKTAALKVESSEEETDDCEDLIAYYKSLKNNITANITDHW